jgi:hypothetical protein
MYMNLPEGGPGFPVGTLGVRLAVQPVKWFRFQTAVFQGNVYAQNVNLHGFRWRLDSQTQSWSLRSRRPWNSFWWLVVPIDFSVFLRARTTRDPSRPVLKKFPEVCQSNLQERRRAAPKQVYLALRVARSEVDSFQTLSKERQKVGGANTRTVRYVCDRTLQRIDPTSCSRGPHTKRKFKYGKIRRSLSSLNGVRRATS